MSELARHHISRGDRKAILETIGSVLARCDMVRFAYAHGSFVDPDLPFRDVDVAVYLDEQIPPDKHLDHWMRLQVCLARVIRLPLDVHGLNQAHPGFVSEVSKGRVVFSRDDEEMFDFVERMRLRHMDFSVIQQQMIRDLLTSRVDA